MNIRQKAALVAAIIFSMTTVVRASEPATYIEAYKAFQIALDEGDHDTAIAMAETAWEMAEAKGAVNEDTLAVLAQNYAVLILWDAPKQAKAPADRALELGKAGYGLSQFTLTELEVMAAAADALDNPNTPRRRALIEALDAHWAAGGEANDLTMMAGSRLASISLERTAWQDAVDVTFPLAEAISRLPDVPERELGAIAIMHAAAILNAKDIMAHDIPIRNSRGTSNQIESAASAETRMNPALLTAYSALEVSRRFFPLQEDLDSFDPVLAQVIAWKGLVNAYGKRTDADFDDIELADYWNGTVPEDVETTFIDQCTEEEEPTFSDGRRSPDFPNKALRTLTGGSLYIGYEINEKGHTENARILASIPQDIFEEVTLEALNSWQADIEGVPPHCRTNQTTQFFYVMKRIN